MRRGWIKVYRQLVDHWLWRGERFTRGQAWIDLLLSANHHDRQIRLGNQLVTVKRGQVLVSQRQLVSRWRWARNTIARFLRVLKLDEMLSHEVSRGPEGGYTLITILNYERYQGSDEEHSEDTLSHSVSHGRDTLGTRLEPYLINKETKKRTRTPLSSFNDKAFWEKFSSQDHEVIHQTIQAIHSTRRRGKVADSIIQAEFRWWDQQNPAQVTQGMRTYLEKGYAGQGKGEKYLRGIIRNSDEQSPGSSPAVGKGHSAIQRAAMSMTREDCGE